MTDRAFTLMATVTVSTKRPPALVDGVRGDPETKIEELSCLPLDPVDAELRQRLAIDTPHELLQTYVQDGLDIEEGDLLVVGSREYPIRSCAEWRWDPDGEDYVRLILEDLKR